MKYTVEYTPKAQKTLKKLDPHTAFFIKSWITKNLEGCSNPYQHGKSLTANRSGQWRYRVGDYRLISEVHEDKIVILVLNIGHRRDIYNNK